MFELLGKTHIDFIGKRRYAFLFSGILALVGTAAVIQIARGQANTGIDFAGGTAVQLKFEKPLHLDEARALLQREGVPDAELQQFTEGNKLLVRVKKHTTIQEKTADRLVEVFQKGYFFRDRLLRPALVRVAKGGAAADDGEPEAVH